MEISSEIFESWEKSLDNFHKGVKKDLEEIREYKRQIQQIREEIYDRLEKGTYIQDDQRIIISAPEIIIGNVDSAGVLKGGNSTVIVRGNSIGLEGVGDGAYGVGSIVSRASVISQIGVDPGPDGLENMVKSSSSITSHAKAISMISEDHEGLFTERSMATGIELLSDTSIGIDATTSCKYREDNLKKLEKELQSRLKECEKDANDTKKEIDKAMADLKMIVKKDSYEDDIFTIRTHTNDISQLHEEFNAVAKTLYQSQTYYMSCLSRLAEVNRQMSCVNDLQKDLSKDKSSFKTKSTETSVSINSESISLSSVDGDGNVRTTNDAAINLNAKSIVASSYDEEGELIKESTLDLASSDMVISTANPKIKDDKGDVLSQGSFTLNSKSVVLEGLDYELKNDNLEEKSLAKDGSLKLRFENIELDTTSTEGKSVGHIDVNAKQIEVKSMDVDKEKRTDKSLTTGSSLLLLSEKVFAGSRDKKLKSKQLQLASDEIAAIGEKTVELQQGKALVQLDGGDTGVSGGKTQLYGATTLFGKTAFKSDLEAGDIDVKNIKIKSSFKSPCTSEGMAVPGAPSTAKLSAKLKEEELKKDK